MALESVNGGKKNRKTFYRSLLLVGYGFCLLICLASHVKIVYDKF